MRVIFMGTPSYATEILKALLKESFVDVSLVVTQPDKKVGRKQIITPPHIKSYMIENGIETEIFQPKSLKEQKSIDKIKSFKSDFIVVAAYGQILPKEILDIAPCINLHASILPKYRGASPIQSAILDEEVFTGVTAMLMDEGLDTGDMLGFSYVKTDDLNAPQLFELLSKKAADLTLGVLKDFGNIKPIPQTEALATYAKKITKKDALISFDDAKKIYAKYKAFYFWPGINLKSGLKLKEIRFLENESFNEEGKILKTDKEGAFIGCKRGTLKLLRIQPPSKKEMGIIEYMRGKRIKVGDYLS